MGAIRVSSEPRAIRVSCLASSMSIFQITIWDIVQWRHRSTGRLEQVSNICVCIIFSPVDLRHQSHLGKRYRGDVEESRVPRVSLAPVQSFHMEFAVGARFDQQSHDRCRTVPTRIDGVEQWRMPVQAIRIHASGGIHVSTRFDQAPSGAHVSVFRSDMEQRHVLERRE